MATSVNPISPVTLVVPTQLLKVAPNLNSTKAIEICANLNLICPQYGIDTKNKFHEFIATILHESGQFSITVENMYYTTPQRLMAIWPKHFPSISFASKYIKSPMKLANYIYGSTSIAKALGNIKPEDGYNFRGSGPMQLTGRYSHTKFATYMKEPNIEISAEKLRTNLVYGIHSACWEFSIEKDLDDEAERDDFKTITKRINGGYIGMADREKYLKAARLYIV